LLAALVHSNDAATKLKKKKSPIYVRPQKKMPWRNTKQGLGDAGGLDDRAKSSFAPKEDLPSMVANVRMPADLDGGKNGIAKLPKKLRAEQVQKHPRSNTPVWGAGLKLGKRLDVNEGQPDKNLQLGALNRCAKNLA